jgi:hypothetical protein
MMLFLLAGIPVFLVLVLNLFFSGVYDGKAVFLSAGKGVLWFFPGILVLGLLAGYFSPAFEGNALYFTRTLLDFVFPLFAAVAAYLFSHRKDLIIPGEIQFVRILSFLAGFFTLFAFYCIVSYSAWYAGYLYFLMPLLWMSLIVLAGFVMGAFFSLVTGLRFFVLAGGAVLALLMGAVPYLYVLNFRLSAWFLTLLFFAGSLLTLPKGFVFLK